MEELLRLTRENNQMLKWVTAYLQHESKHDDITDFMTNIAANILGNRIDGIGSKFYPLNRR